MTCQYCRQEMKTITGIGVDHKTTYLCENFDCPGKQKCPKCKSQNLGIILSGNVAIMECTYCKTEWKHSI